MQLSDGRSDRIRTYDPLVPNEVRYQAALHSDDEQRHHACSRGAIARDNTTRKLGCGHSQAKCRSEDTDPWAGRVSADAKR